MLLCSQLQPGYVACTVQTVKEIVLGRGGFNVGGTPLALFKNFAMDDRVGGVLGLWIA